MRGKKVFTYSEYQRKVVEVRVDYTVFADSKEEADEVIKKSASEWGIDDTEFPDQLRLDGEVVMNDDEEMLNFCVLDEEEHCVISSKELEEEEGD